MSEDSLTPKQKRQYYIVAFCIALGIDVIAALVRGDDYQPSLIGSAIMIAAVLYFAVSLIRER